MACPLFIPTAALSDMVAVAAPLGNLHSGHCAADPTAAIDPETLRRYCNFGYARGYCDRAAQSHADAVRFLVRAAHGNTVEIAWSMERNHHPVAVGIIEIVIGAEPPAPQSQANETQANDPHLRQSYACAAAYVSQIGANAQQH